MRKQTNYLFGAILLGSLGLASRWTVSLSAENYRLLVQPVDVNVSLGRVDENSLTPFEFTLANHGSRPVKIVGFPSLCGKLGCLNAVELPELIPAGRSIKFHCLYLARSGGHFELTTKILLDVGEELGVEVPVTIRGLVAVPEKTS